MKKHLIAAAVAAAVAVPAAAQVTVYGRFDQAYYHVKGSGVITDFVSLSGKSTTTGLDGGIGGSRLGFRAEEDLGGGLKATVVYEYGADPGENVGANTTRLGFAQIAGGFGQLRAGRQVSPVKGVLDGFLASGNNTTFAPGELMAGAGSGATLAEVRGFMNADNRVSNAITYVTPTVGGLSAQVQYSGSYVKVPAGTATAATNTEPNSNTPAGQAVGQGLSINYSAGPLAIAVAQFQTDAKATVAPTSTKDTTNVYAGTYRLGTVTLHLAYAEREMKTTEKLADNELWTIGATVPLGGALSANLQYSDGEAKGLNGDPQIDVSGYKLRANYALSKRTSFYGIFGKTEAEASSVSAKLKLDGYAIGLVHTF